METEGHANDNLEGTKGQVEGNQGQAKKSSGTAGSQPDLVELPGGEKVTREELVKGYMKDADYRQKTATVKEEKERAEEERRQYEAERQALYNQRIPTGEEEKEEQNPIDVLNARVQNMEVHYLRDYLQKEIQSKSTKYPDADTAAVFDACWANPRANIEKEMEKNQTRIAAARENVTVEQVLSRDAEAKKKYDSKIINDWLAKKQQKDDAGSGVGSGSGEIVIENEEKPVAKSYGDIGRRIKEKMKERKSVGELD